MAAGGAAGGFGYSSAVVALDYQPQEHVLKRPRSLRRRTFLAVVIGLAVGGVSFFLAVAAVSGLPLPFILVSGPAAALILEVAGHYLMNDSLLVPLLLIAEAIQYTCYGLLLFIRFPGRKLVLAAALALHSGCCIFVYTHRSLLH